MEVTRGRFHWTILVLCFDYARILLAVRKRVIGYW